MANSFFRFKQFIIHQDRCAMKVTTDACLFGAWVASRLADQRHINNVLDIGAGTGLLSLMLAQKIHSTIDAIEIDPDAAAQANENIADSPWKERVRLIQSDVANYSFAHVYDVILSNPPFYENEWKSPDAKKNTAHHSEDLSFPQLLSVIKKNLSPQGRFFLLLPAKRSEEIGTLFNDAALGIEHICFVRQSTIHSFFRMMISGGHQKTSLEITNTEITIKDGDVYTPAFTALLKDYYLLL